MRSKFSDPWIPIERLEGFVQIEPALVSIGLGIAAWVIYKTLLRGISERRHEMLKALFSNLAMHLLAMAGLFGAYVACRGLSEAHPVLLRVSSYVGLLGLFSGATVFIKTWRILVFEYLFLGHMREGVPVLLVNIFTLLLSIFLGGWIITDIFNINLAPLLATSAIFSLVLGLALQDTLGQLFAGISLQFDKPYEIGDWIEVESGGQKWVGQVHEISWRATVLIGFAEENQTIPNRVMAQAHISNFSLKTRPIVRSQVFKIPYGEDTREIKAILLHSIAGIEGIRKKPAPLVLMTEANESWKSFKLIYFIDDFGSQYLIADKVLNSAMDQLQARGIAIASSRILVLQPETPERATPGVTGKRVPAQLS